mmetsp:Transcript_9210/g.17335  ORF Transcript_9210/g.17335 Transcript_9210/m.17335 type:complete len:659 (+) Transcript_9210:265-2241(+)
MPRFDLAFFLCCCKACLGSPDNNNNNNDNDNDSLSFYTLLSVEPDATPEEIKRAYKRQSLQMHPDKLAQRGQTVTPADQAKFQRMKEAYEVLSDPHKRETYDAIGERGMKWIEDPLSMDLQEMANNFAKSSLVDRSKIFSIFLFLAVAVLIQPLLICLQLDKRFGEESKWTSVLTPLWIWNAFILFYHVRVIMMGKVPRPDHIPEEDWRDPLPMKMRIVSLIRFLLLFAFEIQLALHLDGVNSYSWFWVLAPLFVLEVFVVIRKFPDTRLTVVTLEELQSAMGKPYEEFTSEEKIMLEKMYLVVPERDGAPYDAARKVIRGAKMEMAKATLRLVFMILVLIKLDRDLAWSWWLVFTPIFFTSIYVCCGHLQSFSEVQEEVEEKLKRYDDHDENHVVHETDGSGGGGESKVTDYGAMEEGEAKNNEESPISSAPTPLTEEEKDEIRTRVARSGSSLLSACCSQIFLLILLCLVVVKIQGAGFSTVWLISPFLFIVSIILCILGCMIFCVSPIDEHEMMFDPQNPTGRYFNMDSAQVPSTTIPAAAAAHAVSATSEDIESTAPTDPPTTAATVSKDGESISDKIKEDEEEERVERSLSNDKGGQKHGTSSDEPKNTECVPTSGVLSQTSGSDVDFLDCDPQPSDELRVLAPTPSEVDDLD